MESKPIWHSPQWITAIVALVTSLLTIPDVVGTYLSKAQDIKLAEQQIELAKIQNQDEIQKNKFKPLLTVIQNRPDDRPTILRFILETSENKALQSWAEAELTELDKD